MRKDLEMVLILIGASIMLWFALSVLIIGKELHGSDAALLWASGILSLLGINGIANFVLYLVGRNK